MQAVAVILFILLFAATMIEYVRRRDPISRDVTLTFSGLALISVMSLLKDWIGTPAPLVFVALGLFLLQPVFTLHLVSQIRPVPGRLLWGGAALLVVLAAV